MKASILAERAGYDLAGDDCDITGIAYYDEASRTDIAVIKNRSEIDKTQASAVLVHPVFIQTSKSMIMTYDNMDLAMVKICGVLMEEGLLKNYAMPMNPVLDERGFYIGINSEISSSAAVHPGVVIGNDVRIGSGCVLEPFVVIGSGTVLQDHVFIGSGSKVGAESFYHYYDDTDVLSHFTGCGQTIIGEGTHIGSNSIIERGTVSNTIIGKSCMIGSCVDIGHDVKIGDYCKIVSQAGIAGNAVLKNNVTVYGQAGIANGVVIGNHAVIKAKTTVSRPVPDNQTVFGVFGREYKDELRLAAKVRKFFERKDV